MGCMLPWRDTVDRTVSTCQYYEELNKLENITKLIASLDETHIAELTNCHKSCSKMNYISR